MTDSPFVEAPVSVGGILARTAGLLRTSALRVTIALALLAAPGIAIESDLVHVGGAYGAALFEFALALIMQFWLTRVLLDELGASGSGRTRFAAFVGLVLLSTLGILTGLLLLVVPGIIFFVRWSISTPILLGSDAGVVESLQRSWRETEQHFWPILGALAAIHAPALALDVAAYVAPGTMAAPLAVAIVINLIFQAAAIAGWYAAVAICTLLAGRGTLSKVFE